MCRLLFFLAFTLMTFKLAFSQNLDPVRLLDYGDNYFASISSFGEKDIYEFKGESGDVIHIRVRDEYDVDAYIELFNPEGKLIAMNWSDGGLAKIKNFRLDQSGTFTLKIHDRNNNDIGNYGISLHKLGSNNYSTLLPELISLTDTIHSICAINSYRIYAEKGDVLFAQMRALTEHFECEFYIYDIDGNEVYKAENTGRLATVGPVTIPTSGPYYIQIMDRGGNDTDIYGFTCLLTNKHNLANKISCGNSEEGKIYQLCERVVYQYKPEIGSNTLLELRSLNNSLESTLDVFNSKGELIGSMTNSGKLLSLLIPASMSEESYLIAASDKNGNDFGTYGLQVHSFGENSCSTFLSCTNGYQEININQLAEGHLFSIEGQEGNHININLKEIDLHLEPVIRLFDHYGNLLIEQRNNVNASLNDQLFPYTGQYFVLVNDQSGNDLGAMELHVNKEDFFLEMNPCVTTYFGLYPFCERTLGTGINGNGYHFEWSNGETSPTITVCPEDKTNYSVTVTNSEGCTAVGSTFVDVINSQCGNENNPKVTICHINTNTGARSEMCIDEEGVWGHLENGKGHEQCFIGPCNEVSICNSDKTIIDEEEVEVRSANVQDDWELTIYPNPAETDFHISIQNNNSQTPIIVEIFNLEGKKVYEGQWSGLEDISLNVRDQNLHPGIYYVRVHNQFFQNIKSIVIL